MTVDRHDPLVIECTRGPAIESRHVVDIALVDPAGALVEGWGEVDTVVYPRSAIKSVQVLPLIETGAAEHFAITDEEIALACSSHSGEPAHVALVRDWLARIGLDESALECGGHLPHHGPSAQACVRRGETGLAVHNMCSGKHTGFLATAQALGEPTAGYIARAHPVQERVSRAIAEMASHEVSGAPWAIDGCSIPTIGLPLHALACAAARIAEPGALTPARQAAVQRVRQAIAGHPFMIAGTGRACTRIVGQAGDRMLVKVGAEGVYFAALTALGLGLALKVRDGAWRAAEVAVTTMLERLGLLAVEDRRALADLLAAPLSNWRGVQVGEVRAAHDT